MTNESPTSGLLWYCVRRKGIAKRGGWLRSVELANVRNVLKVSSDEVVEVCTVKASQSFGPQQFSSAFFNRVRGLVGIDIQLGGMISRISPTRMIAANLSFERALERTLSEHHLDIQEFTDTGAVRSLSGRQFLLYGGTEVRTVELYRGSTLINEATNRHECSASGLAESIAQWMINNQAQNGQIPYKYWPSRGKNSPADNAIRNFLASWSLARWGKLSGDVVASRAARSNLRFNLSRYFRCIGGGRGAIVESSGAKLGAAAVAGLAILEQAKPDEFSEELKMLCAGINSLVDRRHGFRTFYFPAERVGENWNFYSGEALLFFAEAIRCGLPGAPSLASCIKVFDRCRVHHRRSRNPAFVPWHTQACASLVALTGERRFADFAFEMNDWLLPMQQWESVPPDMRGRFHNPSRPDFGPPHAASTGVYLEGLAAAFSLAHKSHDHARAISYRRATRRGLRALRQLQFRGEDDAFYVSRKERVIGALRTEVYDNAIRVDSAAHGLLAASKVLELDTFA